MLLDGKSKLPIYQQLKTSIIEQIGQGILSPNEQLPPVRVLARELGVNPNTVQRAYTELETMGIIYQVVGKGSFVSIDHNVGKQLVGEKLMEVEKILQKTKELGVEKEEILHLVEKVYQEEKADD